MLTYLKKGTDEIRYITPPITKYAYNWKFKVISSLLLVLFLTSAICFIRLLFPSTGLRIKCKDGINLPLSRATLNASTWKEVDELLKPTTVHPLPNCLIIGARKCGTRALLEFLNIHPQVGIAPEEVHFFDDESAFTHGLNWYRAQMPPLEPDLRVITEKSPSYFISKPAPRRVQAMNATIKLLLILRNPVTRVVSDYAQMVENRERKGRFFKTLERAVLNPRTGEVNPRSRLIRISCYHNFIRNWYQHFPREQIHIVDGDKLIIDPIAEMARVERFLDLKPHIRSSHLVYNATKGFYCVNSHGGSPHCLGEGKGRKHPHVSRETLDKLNRYFESHNKLLFRLTGHSFYYEA